MWTTLLVQNWWLNGAGPVVPLAILPGGVWKQESRGLVYKEEPRGLTWEQEGRGTVWKQEGRDSF